MGREQDVDSFTPVLNHMWTVHTTLEQSAPRLLINVEKHDYRTPVWTGWDSFSLVCAVHEQYQDSPSIVCRQSLLTGSSEKSPQQK